MKYDLAPKGEKPLPWFALTWGTQRSGRIIRLPIHSAVIKSTDSMDQSFTLPGWPLVADRWNERLNARWKPKGERYDLVILRSEWNVGGRIGAGEGHQIRNDPGFICFWQAGSFTAQKKADWSFPRSAQFLTQ